MLRRMARAYVQRLPEPWRDLVPLRMDILSVYDLPGGPEFDHLPNAFPPAFSQSAGNRGATGGV